MMDGDELDEVIPEGLADRWARRDEQYKMAAGRRGVYLTPAEIGAIRSLREGEAELEGDIKLVRQAQTWQPPL